jgi:osmotically-inducible protein OsmY
MAFMRIWIPAFLVLVAAGCENTGVNGARDRDDVRDDKRIAAAVHTMFLKDPQLRERNIVVECVRGRLVLSGIVHSEEEKKRAGNLPRYCGDVSEIINRLEVRPPR